MAEGELSEGEAIHYYTTHVVTPFVRFKPPDSRP